MIWEIWGIFHLHNTVFPTYLENHNSNMVSLGFIAPPPPKKNFRSPLDTKAPHPPLIYLAGLLAILDPHINICVGPPNAFVALKQFNLLPLNTLF